MGPDPAGPPGQALDRECGRSDPRDRLRLRLPEAPGDYLEGALDNPETGPDEAVLLLRNPRASAATVARVGRNRGWLRVRSVRTAFVSHPNAPVVGARAQIPHLLWGDLAKLSADVRLSPVLRREAERLLRVRLPELTLGEKVALARRASRGLIPLLADDPDDAVLRALAANAKTTESDVVRMASRGDAPREFLAWLVAGSRWGACRAVRMAVARHPRTPPAAALSAISRLAPGDLHVLEGDGTVPALVRVAAERCRRRPSFPARGARPDHG